MARRAAARSSASSSSVDDTKTRTRWSGVRIAGIRTVWRVAPSDLGADRGHEVSDGGVGSGVEPGDARVAPEPCPLASRGATVATEGEVEGLLEARTPVEVIEELGVAEGLAGRAGEAARIGHEATDLVEEARPHLLVVARGDASAEVVASP